MSDETEKCPMCNGRGYLQCDCWPGDCICGYGDETCEQCCGEGWFYTDELDDPYPDPEPAPPEGNVI